MAQGLRPVCLLMPLLAAVSCAAPAPTEQSVRTAATLPQVEGALSLDGLSAPVQVVRDRWGIPHITAETEQDLFFAQGFVQAQDRLFQMDLWRRSVQGRLAEVLGANFIERDAMTRRIQYRGPADAEWASYGPDAKAIVGAFVRGVNAWIALAQRHLPEEFALAGWAPEPWRPEDLLTRTEAFVASRGAQVELLRARLAHHVGVAAAHRYLPGDRPARVRLSSSVDLSAINPLIGTMLRRVGTPPFFAGLAGPIVGRLNAARLPPALRASPERPTVDQGSAWSMASSHTGTGAAAVASVWLTPLDQPSTRYLVHLKAPGWNVVGVTSPWRPGVVAGHNERIAWSFVVSPADTQDIIVERLHPQDPGQRATPTGWRSLTSATDRVLVKGRAEAYELQQQLRPDGTVMAVDRQRQLAYAMAWSGREPGTAAELGAFALGRATTWPQFRTALGRWRLPVAEFVYADVDGHIGRHVAGLVPTRVSGAGTLPTPGWTTDRVWRGFIPADRLPFVLDPSDGRTIASPGSPARLRRLEDLLRQTPIGPETMRRIQLDLVAWNAQQLIPRLTRLTSPNTKVESARRRLLDWDRRVTTDSVDAPLFVAWERVLLVALAATRMPPTLAIELVPHASSALVDAVLSADGVWFDGDRSAARDRLLIDALTTAVADLEQPTAAEGALPWSRYRLAVFSHPLGVSAQARRRFEAGAYALAGYADTIAASSSVPNERVTAPTVRLMLDLADWDLSRAAIAPGQSEAPDSPHFADLAGPWAAGESVPLAFSEAAVAAAARSRLMLYPRRSTLGGAVVLGSWVFVLGLSLVLGLSFVLGLFPVVRPSTLRGPWGHGPRPVMV